jgi:hypothetical protein
MLLIFQNSNNFYCRWMLFAVRSLVLKNQILDHTVVEFRVPSVHTSYCKVSPSVKS